MSISAEIISDYPKNPDTCRIIHRYFLLGDSVVLDNVQIQERASTRHKFKTFAVWDRLDKRGNNIQRPVLTEEQKRRAIKAIADKIKFKDC